MDLKVTIKVRVRLSVESVTLTLYILRTDLTWIGVW